MTTIMGDTVWTAVGGVEHLEGLSPRRQAFNRMLVDAVNMASATLSRHRLMLVNLGFALLVGGAFAVPLLSALGWHALAMWLFTSYHLICAQIPSHSYFLFGYQLGLCSRNLAIFGSVLAGSVAYRAVQTWLPPLDWALWLLTMVPMALDGGTQLFGWRESTWELRTLTGIIFGLGVCWFVLPYIDRGTSSGGRASRQTVTRPATRR